MAKRLLVRNAETLTYCKFEPKKKDGDSYLKNQLPRIEIHEFLSHNIYYVKF